MAQDIIHILLVEDEPAHVELIQRAFEGRGDQVCLEVVATLAEARKRLAAAAPPDLIIADWRLPDGEGINLLTKTNQRPTTPIVIMTSYGNERVAVEAIQAGALDYVVKSPESLLDMPHIAERALRQWQAQVEKAQMEDALRVSEERFRLLLDQASNIAVQGYRSDGTVCYWNKASEQIYHYTAAEALGQNLVEIIIPPNMRTEVRAAIQQMFETGQGHPAEELWLMRKDGSLTPVYSNHTVIDIPGRGKELYCIDIDLTERKQAEEARAKLEEQLRQAQKMETVGRLAGGVAHDFNNILTAILGYAELLLVRFNPDDGQRRYVEQIRIAAERAASLTQQLLAFSRKQMLQPKVLNLNVQVTHIEKMLYHLIGENIELVTLLDPQLGQVEADPSQIDQVVMNLAVNARDAMPKGGKLTIETKNVVLDETYARQYMEVKPGPYVMVAVSDTGIGMDAETQAHLFEPFFTTKEVGKGTGLGLATIYGIVKQSGGHIWVYSEVEQGTTFKIYLPRLAETVEMEAQPTNAAEVQRGDETILLVEDADMVRKLTQSILAQNGYKVLEARDGHEALRVCQEYPGPVHLLLTDVVMPGLSGRELAEQLALSHPKMKILYMSGYTDDTIIHHGLLGPGTVFLQKPFSPAALTQKLREVLDTAG